MPAPPPIKRKSVAPKVPAPPPSPASTRRVAKRFAIQDWTGKGEGEKIVIYGPSGAGKTTLVALMESHVGGDVVFIGLDDGARKIKHPVTNAHLKYIPGVEVFEDVQDVLRQDGLWKPGMVCVIDTVTKLESVAEPFMFRTIKKEKGGDSKSLEDYGYGKGYKHSLDTMRLILQDLDRLVRKGVHVVLLAQEAAVKIANAEGIDYIQDGPKLHHNNQHSTRLEFCEWADHVLRIGYHNMVVTTTDVKVARAGRVSGEATRAIYTANQLHFFAKSRTLDEPVVAFEDKTDDTIWQILFDGD